jgi:hypothetical protein
MRSERRAWRCGVAAWVTWFLAGWAAACTASYLYVMTADQRAAWFGKHDVRQVAGAQREGGP